MEKFPAFTASGSVTIDAAFHAACREVCMRLIDQVHVVVREYAQRYGRIPDQVVVLAGTSVVAALFTLRRGEDWSWHFDQDGGQLTVAGSGVTITVCEYPTLADWDVHLLVPGALALGRVQPHTATLDVPQ